MTQVPTNRTAASSIAEHTSDHNVFATQHNELDGHAADTAAHDLDATIADAIAALVAAAPGTLDTLNELAAALGDDANFASTITTALAGKSATGHGHAESDVTSLVSDLAAKLATAAHTKAAHDALAMSHDSLSDVSANDHHAQAHHAAHEPSGADPMAVDAAAGTGSLRTLGTGAAQAAAGNDARLSDTRTPSALSVTNAMVSATAAIAKTKLAALAIVDADVDAAAAIAETKLALASDAAAGTASRRTLGTGAAQAAAGNHAHSGTYEPSGTVATHAAAADPHTGYVLESLIDAAGDLYVGTADNTPGRLAMGSALQVLRVNAGATTLEYATPASASDMTFARMAFR